MNKGLEEINKGVSLSELNGLGTLLESIRYFHNIYKIIKNR
jgi:hypothetical protein